MTESRRLIRLFFGYAMYRWLVKLPGIPGGSAGREWARSAAGGGNSERGHQGAEQDLHVVVGADLVAIGKRCVRRAVRLVGADAEMHGGRRIPDEHVRGIGGGNAVVRGELRESGEHGGLLPDGLVEDARRP